MYFQLMLPGVRDGEELVLMVDGQRHKVMKHTPETLEKAREKNAALAVMAQDRQGCDVLRRGKEGWARERGWF